MYMYTCVPVGNNAYKRVSAPSLLTSLTGLEFPQAKLDSLEAEQPAPDKTTNTTSLTWRGITYQVRNMRVRANLQQVAEMSQQQQEGMQTDQAAHEAGQYDALIGALIETKASLGSVLKTTPGMCSLLLRPVVECMRLLDKQMLRMQFAAVADCVVVHSMIAYVVDKHAWCVDQRQCSIWVKPWTQTHIWCSAI